MLGRQKLWDFFRRCQTFTALLVGGWQKLNDIRAKGKGHQKGYNYFVSQRKEKIHMLDLRPLIYMYFCRIWRHICKYNIRPPRYLSIFKLY